MADPTLSLTAPESVEAGQPFTVQIDARDTLGRRVGDPALVASVHRNGKLRIVGFAPAEVLLVAAEDATGVGRFGVIWYRADGVTMHAAASIRITAPVVVEPPPDVVDPPPPPPPPDPDPAPAGFACPLAVTRLIQGSGPTRFHMAPTFAAGELQPAQLARLRLVREDTGAEIPIAAPRATAPHFDGSVRAVLLHGVTDCPAIDTPVPVRLEECPDGVAPAPRVAEADVSAWWRSVAGPSPLTGDALATARASGFPDAAIWHRTPEAGCASRPFTVAMLPATAYPTEPAHLRASAARWLDLAPAKFERWAGGYNVDQQYDRPFLTLCEWVKTHDWPLLRWALAYEARYLEMRVPPEGATAAPQYMNTDGVAAMALLFDVPKARAFVAHEAAIGARWLAADDYAPRMWVRNGWSDGDFRPMERRFKHVRWAAILDVPPSGALSWVETYWEGVRALDGAEQWIAVPEVDGARYTHKSVGRYDATTNTGPTPNFMLGLAGSEVFVTARETFGAILPEDVSEIMDRRLAQVCNYLATQVYPSNRGEPAVLYYSDEIPGQPKPWAPGEVFKNPAVNLNAYYTLLLAAAAVRLNRADLRELALQLARVNALDPMDGHAGPYMAGFTDVEHKVYNQAHQNADRHVWWLARGSA